MMAMAAGGGSDTWWSTRDLHAYIGDNMLYSIIGDDMFACLYRRYACLYRRVDVVRGRGCVCVNERGKSPQGLVPNVPDSEIRA